MRSRAVAWIGGVVFPLVLGGGIYVVLRPPGLLLFEWLRRAGAWPLVRSLRGLAEPAALALPAWAIFSLPNALWAFSLVLCVRLIWSEVPVQRRWIAGAAAGFAIGPELLQAPGYLPGKFDLLDLGLICMFSLAALGIPVPSIARTVP